MKDIRTTSRVRALATLAGGVASARAPGRPGSGMHWLGSTLAALLLLASARAQGPVNPRVTHGNATFEKVGNNWVITTSQKTIVSYSSFDIAHQQWVRFVQPGADARVLNRIDGAAPTRIDGTLLANGRVYFVNPAGVIFGNGAVINCGSFAAAGGQLSDQDFLAGRDHFTNLTGNVENRGRIEVAQGGTATLVGRHVANYGTIVAPQGTVVLAAGNDVLVGETGGHIYARIGGDGIARPEGVRNDGVIEATRGRTLMAAGDIYGMAVINTGRVIARDVKVDGGKKGEVRISGQIDASGKQAGETGGRVEITGENIALMGATVDVSGDSGGGTALIGGGREGQGLENTANALYASTDSRINADAIRAGNGGEIVLYSHNSTMSGAALTARGGTQSGNGGYIETSGGWLAISGAPDTSARALLGKGGEWLIDPLDLDVVSTSTMNMSGPPVFTPVGGPGQLLVNDLLSALSLNSIVTLKTTGTVGGGTGKIRFQTALDLTGLLGTYTLNVISAGAIEINASIHASTAAGLNLNLAAFGDVTIGPTIEVLLNSGTFTSSGVKFDGGKLISAGGGGVWLNHTGDVFLGSITTLAPSSAGPTLFSRGASFTSTGTLKTNGGKIDILASTGNVSLGGVGITAIDTTGSGGVRGDVSVRAKGALTASVPITGNNILLNAGGNMTISGSADATAALDFRAGQDGAGILAFTGAGALSLKGQSISLLAGNSSATGSLVQFARAVSLTSGTSTTIVAGPGTIEITGAGSINQTALNGVVNMIADEVDFSGNLTSALGGKLRLTTATSGRAIVLGASTPGTLNLSTAELAKIGPGFSTLELVKSGQTGNIRVDGATTLPQGVSFLLGSGALTLNADLSVAGAFFNNGRTLIGPGPIKLTAGSATFVGLVDAAAPGANFTVVGTDPASLIRFFSSIGAGSALSSLTIDGPAGATAYVRNVVRSGNTLFKTKTEIQANTTFSGGAVAFNRSLDSGAGGPYSATFLGGPVSFLGGVGQTNALSSILTIGDAIVSGNVTTTGSQSYGGNLNVNAVSTFTAGGPWNVLGATVLDANTIITASEVYFAGAVNSASAVARDLTVTGTSGNVTFASSVGAPPGFALGNLTVDTPGNTYITGTVRAANARFKSATELLSDVSLQGGSFTFDKTLNSRVGGPYALTTLGVSTLTFSGAVGGLLGQQLLSLDATGAALTRLGANVTTDNFVRFGATELNANSVVTSLLNKPIDFGVVTSEPTPWSLEVVTNDVATFNGAVGTGAKRLASLRHTGTGLTILKGDTFTSGLQFFGGDVSFEGVGPQAINAGTTLFVTGSSTLKTDVSVFASGGATFAGSVLSPGVGRSLAVDSLGDVLFGGAVGTAGERLSSLTRTGASGTSILRGNTFTTGSQSFSGDVSFEGAVPQTVDAGTTLFVGGSSILKTDLGVFSPGGATFTGAVTSPGSQHSLSVDSAATVLFGGPVGTGAERLSSLSRTGAAGTTILKGNTFTSGAQSFAGNVSFEGLGAQSADAGTTLFIGGTTALKSNLTVLAPAGATFTGVVFSSGGAHDLHVTSGGLVNFMSEIGLGGSLGALLVDGTGTTRVTTLVDAANATFEQGVDLAANTVFQGGPVTFKQRLDSLIAGGSGAEFKGLAGAGALDLRGAVGGQRSLAFLISRVDTTVRSNVTTVNQQQFDKALDVLGPSIFNAGGSFNATGKTTLTGRATVNAAGVNFGNTIDSAPGIPTGELFVMSTSSAPINFANSIGATNRLLLLDVNGANPVLTTTTINGTLDVGVADLRTRTLLGSDVHLHNGDYTFHQLLDSGPGGPFGVDTAGVANLIFLAHVGSTSPLAFLDAGNAGITILGGNVTANGLIKFGATELDADSIVKSVLGGPIDFGTITSPVAQNLIVDTTGVVTFGGAVGSLINPLASLTVLNASLTKLNGDVSTNAGITLGATELDGGPIIVTSLLGGAIGFGPITSPTPQSLTVNTTGVLTFGGPVGTLANPLASLTTTGAGLTRLNGDVFSNGAIAFGATELNANVKVKSFASTIGFGTLTSPVAHSLIVETPVSATFGGTVGSLANPLLSLDATGSALTKLNGDVFANSFIRFADTELDADVRVKSLASTIAFGAISSPVAHSLIVETPLGATFGGPVGGLANPLLSLDATGAALSKLFGDVFANGAIAFGATELNANVKVKSFASTIGFGTLTSPVAHSLIVETPVSATFGGTVGSLANPLLSLDATGSALTKLNGDVFANSFIRFAATELDNSLLVKSVLGGPIDFGTITSPVAQNLIVDTTGVVTFGGAVGSLINPLASLTVLNASLTKLNGDVSTNAGITLGATELDGGPIIVTSLLGGAIGFGPITSPTPQSLTVNTTGVLTFGGPVGTLANPLASLTTTGAGLTKLNGDVFSNGAIAFGATELNANVKVKSFASTIGFGTLTSPVAHSLIVETPVATTFGGTVGSLANPLLSLDATGSALTKLNGDVFANNFIRFADTELDADATITSVLDQAIEFGAVTSSATPRALGVKTGGTATFHGPIGTSASRLASITRTGAGGLTILQGDTFTTGGQTYAGNVIFDKAFNPLNPQTISAGGPLFIGGTSTLNTNVDVLTNGATFALAVDSGIGGARSLHVTSPGAVLFGGPIGSSFALENITVDGGGTTTLNTKVTTTAGGLAKFDNATLLGSDLDLAGGTFRFGSTLNSGAGGPFALRSVGSGTVEFVGDAGGLSLLRSVDTQLASDTRLHADLKARDDIKLGELRLIGVSAKNVSSATGAIDFFGKVAADAGGALFVSAPGKVEFHQLVGSGVAGFGALGSIVRSGAGLTVLDANTTTIGGQAYSANLDLNGVLTLTSGGPFTVGGLTRMLGNTTLNTAGFFFGGSVDSAGGPRTLLVNNSGLGFFASGLGSGGALAAMTVNGAGTSQFAGNVRLVPGGVMTLNQAAEIMGPSDFRAGTINFNSTLRASIGAVGPSLFLVADSANFVGDVGTLRALQSLDASNVTLSTVFASVNTGGAQTWNRLLLSGAPGVRTFNASGATFLGAVDAASGAIGMAIHAPGVVGFNAPIGFGGAGGTALASLFSGAGITVLGGDVRTLGFTTFGGNLVTTGVRTVNASALTVLGATALGNDFTVNGINARFAGAVDSLAGVNSSLLANVSGEARFENGVGQNSPLRNVRSNAFTNLLRGSLTTIASGQSWFTGELRIDSAPTGLSTIDSGMIFIGRDIFTDGAAAGPANLTLLARAVPTITTAPIRIGGNIGSSSLGGVPSQAFGNLVLGGAIGLPQVSSIVLARTFDSLGRIVASGVSPSDSYVILANSITMSPGQKLTVLGSLTMTGTQSVLIGDITTLGDMNVNSASITIQSRSPYSVLDNAGNPIVDIGTDLVAGGAIHFSRAPIVPPGAGTFSYSALAGPDPTLQNFSFRQYPNPITVNNFRDMRPGSILGPNFLLSLDFASLGPTATNVADTRVVQPPRLGEVQRVRQAVAVDPADEQLLRELGLTVKPASAQEIVQSFIGYSYYQNVPKIPDPNIEAGDYVVTADRLWMKAVSDLVKAYRAEMLRMVPDGTGKFDPQSRSAEIQQLFTDSWDRFAAGKPASNAPEAELREYQEFVLSHPEELATREELARVDAILRRLQNLGLTEMEASIPEERILEMIRPSALTTNDMRRVLGAVRAADVPLGTPEPVGRPGTHTPPVAENATPLFEVSKR